LPPQDASDESKWWIEEVWEKIGGVFSGEPATTDFATVVEGFALAQLRSLLADDAQYTTAERAEAVLRLREVLKEAGPAIRAAGSDQAAVEALTKALATSGSVAGLAAAVELAGFSAYMLAAKASAIIPFVGGKTMVSLLAVIANPLFFIPAVVGGAYWANHSANEKLLGGYAAAVCALLALLALQGPIRGMEQMVNVFSSIPQIRLRFATSSLKSERLSDAWRRYEAQYATISAVKPAAPAEPEDISSDFGGSALLGGSSRDRLDEYLSALLTDKREAAALSALTVGDLLYHAAIINPDVIAAVDFARADDIHGLVSFAAFSEQLFEKSGRSLEGALANIEGYVAERYVATKLIEEGHIVEFPAAANQAGFDLLVDGQQFQVKCLESLSGIRRHFDTYPEIPVIANADLAADLTDAEEEFAGKVFFVDGFTSDTISEMTRAAHEAGADLLDNDVPLFAASLAASRNLLGWWSGELTSKEAFWGTVATASGKAGLSLLGGVSGSAVGLLLFGPAGAVIGGPAGGVLGASQFGRTVNWINGVVDGEGLEKVKQNAASLLHECASVADRRIQGLEKRKGSLGQGPASRYVRGRIADEVTFNREQVARLRTLAKEPLGDSSSAVPRVLAAVVHSSVHPAAYQAALAELTTATSQLDRAIPRILEDVVGGVGKVAGDAATGIAKLLKGLFS
jgi:hypothetical protein